MSEPRTTLDERYSDADAAPVGWDATRRAVEAAELFWVATVRRDGRPHVTPLVAVWSEGALHFCTGAGEQKARNLRANPHVVLSTGSNDWQEGLDVIVEGDAVAVTDAGALARLAEAWTAKWEGQWQYVVGDGCFRHPGDRDEEAERVLVFAVTPSVVHAFAKGAGGGQTTHRF